MGITVLIFWALALACCGFARLYLLFRPWWWGIFFGVIALILSVIWLFQLNDLNAT